MKINKGAKPAHFWASAFKKAKLEIGKLWLLFLITQQPFLKENFILIDY